MEETRILSELRAVGIQIEFLTKAIARLEEQNETRRNSIEAVAHSIRSECHLHQEKYNSEFDKIKRKLEKLETVTEALKWLVGAAIGTAVTYFTLKVINPEIPNVPSHPKPTAERPFKY